MLVYDEKVPRHFWINAVVTEILPSGDFEIRARIVKIANNNTVLKRPLNILFTVENTYHYSNQTDKARKQKLWLEETVTGELKRTCEY